MPSSIHIKSKILKRRKEHNLKFLFFLENSEKEISKMKMHEQKKENTNNKNKKKYSGTSFKFKLHLR